MRRIERSGQDDTPPGISRTGRRHRWRRLAVMALAPLLALSATGATAQGVWLTLPSLPTARLGHAAATAPCPGGLKQACVYVFGGRASDGALRNEFEAYSPATNAWATLPPLPTPRDGLAGRGAPCPGGLQDGCVYAIGGAIGTVATPTSVPTVEAYSPATGAWATLQNLPTARRNLAAAKAPCPPGFGLRGTCVYAIGGRDSVGAALHTVEAYSPATDTWVTLQHLTVARADLGAVGAPCPPGLGLRGGCVYAIDGTGDGSVEVYSPVTNAWVTLRPLPVSHGDRPAVVAAPCPNGLPGGCVYVAGGSGALRLVHAYSPVTGAWITLPETPTPHRRTAGTVAPCPKESTSPCVYVVAGSPDSPTAAGGATEAFAVERGPERPGGPRDQDGGNFSGGPNGSAGPRG
ncbi:Kelch repeat-containing protein [Streptomyces sp. NPDC058691]|uniref:Kelch repeat-containing protein n=1 Tax=Streptomyces sp. NPDC058691 TaxID=3346601 RepID=UPI00365058C7